MIIWYLHLKNIKNVINKHDSCKKVFKFANMANNKI